MQLPDSLRAALEESALGVSMRDLAAAAQSLSERYRERHGEPTAPFIRSDRDVAAYAAYRLPATYVAARAAFEHVRERLPTLEPATLLDVGGGPGTAAWAALAVWPDLARVTILERDARMIRLGKTLATRADSAALRNASWHQVDAGGEWNVEPADVAVAAYLLGELSSDSRQRVLTRLWNHTPSSGVAVVVEPGTPRGYQVVRAAGEVLVSAGGNIVAPFPQDWECTEGASDWCHFSERVPRTRAHRQAKGGALSYEDEKFSYVAASRLAGTSIAGRIIRMPQVRSGHVRLVICTPSGVRHIVVTRRDRDAFRKAKELRWGSAIPVEDARLFGL